VRGTGLPQYDINLREYWRILRKRKLLVIFTSIVLGAFSVAFAVLKAPTPVYTSVCSIKFERQTTIDDLYARAITWSGGDDIETQISLIKSFAVLERVAKKLGLIPKTAPSPENHQKPQVAALIENLQSKVEVTRETNTNILNIQAKDTDPGFAQRLANTIAQTYKDLHSENQMKRITEAIKYIEDQLANVRKKLREAEEDFNKFSQDNQILSIDLQSEKLLARGQEIRNDLRSQAEARDEFVALLASLEQFIKNPKGSDHNFFSTKAHPQYQAANDALVGLMLKRDSMLQEYTPQHPEVVSTDRKIVEYARKMKMLLEQQLKEVDKREQDLLTERADLNRKASDFMEKKMEFDRLKRKVDLYHDMTALLERKNQEALISKAEKPEEVTIVKPALLPTNPINPPKKATTGIMGLLIGLVVGLLAAFVVETFDTSLGAIEEVERILRTNVLGVIPYGDSKGIEERFKEKFPEEKIESISALTADLIAHFSPSSMIAESLRGLRTNIQSRDQEGKNKKTIVVTSASPQEGKTFISINLAITMAQTGLRTLVVGADMRKPTLGKAFGVDNTPGLSEILLGNYAWQDTVKTIADIIVGKMTLDEVMLTPGLDNLQVITSGSIPPNPAELIQSKRFKDFIEEVKTEYDVIILDTPPILSTADSAILGSRVDGVLLVYRIGSVSRGLLKRSITQLEQANCQILGVVLNGVKPEVSPDFQDYKYYRYYHSYGEEERKRGRPKLGLTLLGGEERKDMELPSEAIFEKSLVEEKGSPNKRSAVMKYTLLGVAVALLGGGILWQAVINPRDGIDLRNSERKSVSTPSVKKRIPKPEPKASATALPKPLPAKSVKEGDKMGRVVPAPAAMAKPSDGRVNISVTKTPTEARAAAFPPQFSVQPAPQMEPRGQKTVAPAVRSNPPKLQSSFANRRRQGYGGQEASQDTRIPPRPGDPGFPGRRMEATPEPKTLPPKWASFPYSLYLGSSATRDQAKGAIANYSRKGIFPYWAKVDLGQKGVWFRIYLGHFKSAEDAKRFAAGHGLDEAEVKKTEYANLIGQYAENEGLEKEMKKLSKLGYTPYVIKGADGKSRLYCGAFITEAGAERLQGELKSNGIDSRIMHR
jgi:succinoglycan biosynthesis transport protein ExoP